MLVPCAPRAQDTAATPAFVRLPAYSLVLLRMGERVNSDRNKAGDRFRFRVAEDVLVDGLVAIPAGSQGEGEVIHADDSGGTDHPGELVLAARFVTVGDQEIKLRTFVAGSTNPEHDALAVPIFDKKGSGRGDSANLGQGGMASARTAQDVMLLPQVSDGTIPAAVTSDAEPRRIEFTKSTGTVVFFSERFRSGSRRKSYEIRDNGRAVGKLAYGGQLTIEVPVGIHVFASRGHPIQDIRLEIDGGETYYVACGEPKSTFRTHCAPSNRSMFEYMRPETAKAK
jgi:hypothetical protein